MSPAGGGSHNSSPATTISAPLADHEARDLTDRISQAADDLWALLLEAYEGRAWAALGYRTWEEYTSTEFGMSRGYAYRLLDHGRVLREIESVTGVSPSGDVTEAASRDLKPHLEVVKDAIRQAVENVPEERVAEIVAEVVADERTRIVREREERAEAEELAAEFDPGPDFDWDRDRELLREGGAIYRVTEELAGFRSPSEFIEDHVGDINESLISAARRGRDWLDAFLAEWEAQCQRR